MLPTIKQISHASENYFTIEDIHNFGADYDKTLMAWHENFTNAWDQLKSRYDERFRRMWEYYLLSCAALFVLDRHNFGKLCSLKAVCQVVIARCVNCHYEIISVIYALMAGSLSISRSRLTSGSLNSMSDCFHRRPLMLRVCRSSQSSCRKTEMEEICQLRV